MSINNKTKAVLREMLIWLGWGTLMAVIGFTAGPTFSPELPTGTARTTGAALGAVTGISGVALTRAREWLGTTTSVAGMSLVWGLVLAVWAATASSCPGVAEPGRCDAQSLATFGTIGALYVILLAVAVFPPLLAVRFGRVFLVRSQTWRATAHLPDPDHPRKGTKRSRRARKAARSSS